jgi:hypothetical protein
MRLLFLLAPLLLLPALLPGQDLSPPETGGTSYIERTGEEERFIQRLVWEEAEYVYRYEITVEEQTGSGEYAEIHRESRTENFIDLSLPPGSYRYRIGVYNLLNRPAGLSAWIPFRVLRAVQPELFSFSRETPEEIILRGANLVDGAEVRLRPAEGGGDLAPPAYLPGGESARLRFRDALPPGRYRVYVKNPGGLEASLEILIPPPPVSPPAAHVPNFRGVYVSAEYAPLIPLSGYLFEPLDAAFHPLGLSLRLGLVPLSRNWGDLGLELAPAWHMLKADAVEVHLGNLQLNGLYQRWFLDHTVSLIVRLGTGIILVYGTNNAEQDAASIFTWMAAAGGGLSLRWFLPVLHGRFYLEAGADYTHLFANDSVTAYGKPFVGAGWRF